MLRSSLRLLAFLVAAALPVLIPSSIHAQQPKVLVYCPGGADAAKCTAIVDALTTGTGAPYLSTEVKRAYDGSGSPTTVDLRIATGLGQSQVLIVPSLGDNQSGSVVPYSLLRNNAQVKANLSAVLTGRVAVYSGTPDQAPTVDASKKTTLIRNLVNWAKQGHTGSANVGLVVLQDFSHPSRTPYSWVNGIAGVTVNEDGNQKFYFKIDPTTVPGGSAAAAILDNGSGQLLQYATMAAEGVKSDATGATAAAKGIFLNNGNNEVQGNNVVLSFDRVPPKATTAMSAVSGSGTFGETATLTATLKVGTDGVSGKTVAFELNGTSVGTASTSTSGVATLPDVSLAGFSAGTHTGKVKAIFTEDGTHKGSSATGDLSVAQATGSISITGPSSIEYNKTGTITPTVTGDGAVSYGATAGGGTVCSVNSSTGVVTMLTGTGTCKVQATLAAGTNYTGATSNELTITATKATQIISWSNPADIVYGTALGATQLNAQVTTGDGTLTYDPAAGMVLNAGTHTLKVDALETTNYKAASATVSIKVEKATLTVTADAQTKTYDGQPFTGFTATYTGFVNGDTKETVTITGSPAFNGPAATAVDAGTYAIAPIGVSGLSADNYKFVAATTGHGQLVIKPAPVTITLGALTGQVYDALPKAPTVTASLPNFSSYSITFDGSSTAPTDAGSYAVVVKLTSSNYQLVDAAQVVLNPQEVTDTFVIDKANSSVSLVSAGTITNNGTRVTLTAKLTRVPGNVSLGGRTIKFTLNGQAVGQIATDNTTGVATLSNVDISSLSAAGSYAIGAAFDGDQNHNSATGTGTFQRNYDLSSYAFLQPINANGTRSIFRQGSTIPVKFKLTANGAPVAVTNATISVFQVDKNAQAGVNEETPVLLPDGGNLFRWDASGLQNIFNFGTKIMAVGTIKIVATLPDGSTITSDCDLALK
jgi:hypothetical protein